MITIEKLRSLEINGRPVSKSRLIVNKEPKGSSDVLHSLVSYHLPSYMWFVFRKLITNLQWSVVEQIFFYELCINFFLFVFS